MSLGALIQLIASCVGILGSLFFAIGVLRQSVEAMARLSGSYWDWNPHMPPALAAQKADYVFGGGLIVLAFALQLVSYFAPPEVQALSRTAGRYAPWVAGVVTIAAFFLLRRVSERVARRYEEQIRTWLQQRINKKEG